MEAVPRKTSVWELTAEEVEAGVAVDSILYVRRIHSNIVESNDSVSNLLFESNFT